MNLDAPNVRATAGFRATLKALPTLIKIGITVLGDAGILVLCVMLAYVLRASVFEMPPPHSLPRYLLGPAIGIILAAAFGIYRNSLRMFDHSQERHILFSQLAVAPVWAFVLIILGLEDFFRSVIVIHVVLAMIGMIGLRRVVAGLLDVKVAPFMPVKEPVPILIFGAGRDGMALANALDRHPRFRLKAFVDMDYTLVGRRVGGRKVHPIEQLGEVIDRHKLKEVFIADSSLSRTSRRMLVEKLLSYGLIVKTAPGVSDLLSGNLNVDGLKPVNVTDLLGRDPVPPNRALMEKAVKGKSVLVSGAGGSIGAELVRQVAEFEPSRIVMLDNSEFALFEIHRTIVARLAGRLAPPEVVPILGDIQDESLMLKLMQVQGIEVVFHAAAYKHVHMVQANPVAGIINNVWGTLSLAKAAINSGVKLFVMISTDKAVRPTSVMGASKRAAEMVIQALASQSGRKPVFAMVRFGNVLGSTGSVVPLFKEQIENGGPVLVTDPSVTRYFMLIPEAAQLVIQAAAMAEGGEVFVLDMGEPVKITQLAKTMIELAGRSLRNEKNPDGDIEIKYIGLREGEKLYEELQIGNDISPTVHPRIMKSREFHLPWRRLEAVLKRAEKSLERERTSAHVNMAMELSKMDFGE